MDIELAEKVHRLYDELSRLESERHGIWKSMLPQEEIYKRVEEIDKSLEKIRAEIEEI